MLPGTLPEYWQGLGHSNLYAFTLKNHNGAFSEQGTEKAPSLLWEK